MTTKTLVPNARNVTFLQQLIAKIDTKAPPTVASLSASAIITGITGNLTAFILMSNDLYSSAQQPLIMVSTVLGISGLALIVGAKLQRLHNRLD